MEYENCWFEIKSGEKRMMLTRNREDFMDRVHVLSRLHANIDLFRVENGRRSRVFLSEDFRRRKPSAFSSLGC